MNDFSLLLDRLMELLDRLENLLPPAPKQTDWQQQAFRWRKLGTRGYLQSIPHPHCLYWEDLLCIEEQKATILRNTQRFLTGNPANNALLWGSRGTGKSSLVKALFQRFRNQGLRLIEVDKEDLVDLPEILAIIQDRPERFLLFCDDLSFGAGESQYKTLKAVLEGSLSAVPENLLIYATSNRRHLLPEFQGENQEARWVDGELHPGETVEEKISLSDRFGLWVAFHPFTQEQYLKMVRHWIERLGGRPEEEIETWQKKALQWALTRGSRSGRTAWQFARDWVQLPVQTA